MVLRAKGNESEIGNVELCLLERRLGRLHAHQRLGVERDHEAQVFGQGLNFFHIENSPLSALVIEYGLRMTGLFRRGCRNAERVEVRRNRVVTAELPENFHGFSVLHLSDLHCEMSLRAMQGMADPLATVRYDICVLTGDYRGETFGPFDATLEAIAQLRPTGLSVGSAVRTGLRSLFGTVGQMLQNRAMARFLLAHLFFRRANLLARRFPITPGSRPVMDLTPASSAVRLTERLKQISATEQCDD